MSTTICLVNGQHVTSYNFFLLMRILKTYSLSSFWIYKTVLLMIVTMLYNISPERLCLVIESFYILAIFTQLSAPTPYLWQPLICSMFLWIHFFYIPQISELIWCLFFFVWLISHNIISSRFIRVVTNGRISFFFNGWIISHYRTHTHTHFLYPLMYW